MISLFTGDNDFEIREALGDLRRSFDGAVEKVEGGDLTLAQLPDLLMGVSLFAPTRLVIIEGISANTVLWEKLPEWLPRISEEIHVVFVDAKPDKRTTSYKALKSVADVKEFPAWSERDYAKAEQWLQQRANAQGVSIDPRVVRHIVQRVGLNQWQLASALDTIALLDTITTETIDGIIPAALSENVFQLFETALEGKRGEVSRMITILAVQEDPYALFALLSSQATSLAAVAFKEEGSDPVKDFALHPFVATKLTRQAGRLGQAKVAEVLQHFAKADADLKRSRGEPWVVLEKLLLSFS